MYYRHGYGRRPHRKRRLRTYPMPLRPLLLTLRVVAFAAKAALILAAVFVGLPLLFALHSKRTILRNQ